MELGVKTIIGGVALFILGGLSVYLLTTPSRNATAANPETETRSASAQVSVATTHSAVSSNLTETESFYEAAEARREQQLIERAEADRLAQLMAIKERSVECKFWKQQEKTTSASAKIEEKIIQYCTLQMSSSSKSSESSSPDITSEKASSSITR